MIIFTYQNFIDNKYNYLHSALCMLAWSFIGNEVFHLIFIFSFITSNER